jgi:hypothetical protein
MNQSFLLAFVLPTMIYSEEFIDRALSKALSWSNICTAYLVTVSGNKYKALIVLSPIVLSPDCFATLSDLYQHYMVVPIKEM